jgi:hypothetical protein
LAVLPAVSSVCAFARDNPPADRVRVTRKGARKARIQRSGIGKRGGRRVVYYVALGRDRFYMMTAYPKSERDDLDKLSDLVHVPNR